jgi:hypothetical protein
LTTLGPELFEQLNSRQWVGNQRSVVYGAEGLSARDFAVIEDQLGVRLPEDFVFLFGNLRDPGRVLFPWSNFRKEDYEASIEWVWHGIAFDIEHNAWIDRWGVRPTALPEALEVARADFETWPKLLPICGHRFLAAEPCRPGNPVFSIKQLDIVYYGADLAHYLAVEFLGADREAQIVDQDVRRVDIWSDIAEGRINPYAGLRP